MARPDAVPTLPRSLLSRAEVVSLVGFRQWHHERSGFALERPSFQGAETPDPSHDCSGRAAASSGDCPGVDARRLRVWRTRGVTAGAVDVAPGRGQARDLERGRDSE